MLITGNRAVDVHKKSGQSANRVNGNNVFFKKHFKIVGLREFTRIYSSQAHGLYQMMEAVRVSAAATAWRRSGKRHVFFFTELFSYSKSIEHFYILYQSVQHKFIFQI